MKLFPVTYKPNVLAIFRLLASRYKVSDADFVCDMFTVLRQKGQCLGYDRAAIMARATLEATRLKTAPSVVNMTLARRHAFLKQLYALPGVQTRLKQNANPLVTTEQCLELYRRMFCLLREAQCRTCALLTSCAFGKQYGSAVRDIRTVKDPDYASKMHPDCPLRPNIEAENNMAEAAAMRASLDGAALQAAGVSGAIKTVADDQAAAADAVDSIPSSSPPEGIELDEDPYNLDEQHSGSGGQGAGKGITATATASLVGSNAVLQDSLINSLSSATLCLYMLSLRFDAILNQHKPGLYSPTPKLTPDSHDRNIKSVGEVTKVKLSEHLKDDEVFEQKMHTKELQTEQHLEEDEKKQLLYVLIDTSPSMGCRLSGASPHAAYLERSTLACAFLLALCRKVQREGGILFVRNFDTGVGPLKSSAASGFDELEKHIASLSFDGNGTEIYNAIARAASDINGKVAQHIDTAEVLVITDVEDGDLTSRASTLNALLGSTALNILDVSGGPPQLKAFDAVVDNYMAVDPKNPSLEAIVSVVGGKKKVTQK